VKSLLNFEEACAKAVGSFKPNLHSMHDISAANRTKHNFLDRVKLLLTHNSQESLAPKRKLEVKKMQHGKAPDHSSPRLCRIQNAIDCERPLAVHLVRVA
jgi:hypothetical protein